MVYELFDLIMLNQGHMQLWCARRITRKSQYSFCGILIREEEFVKLLRCGFIITLNTHCLMTTFPTKRCTILEMHFFLCLLCLDISRLN